MSLLETAEEFEKDFTKALQTLHVLAAKYGLPSPTVVMDMPWKGPVRCMPSLRHGDINGGTMLGIGVRFGNFRVNQVTFEEYR